MTEFDPAATDLQGAARHATPDAGRYCEDQVRRYDRDRYLSVLFAPVDRRTDLLALYAFNLEIAKTRETVSEAMLGRIRLQWWREAIDGIYAGTPRHHQIVQALAAGVTRHALPREPFDRLIDARELDLEDRPIGSLQDLVDYGDASSATLLQLGARVLGEAGDETADDGLWGIGVGYALAGLLRALPHHVRARRSMLPADVLQRHGVSDRALFSLKPGPELNAAVTEIADKARDHLEVAKTRRPHMPRRWRAVRMLAVIAKAHLDALERAGHDVYNPRLGRVSDTLGLRLSWAALTRRY